MENDKIIRMITEKCDVYYDDALLSKEKFWRSIFSFSPSKSIPKNVP